MANDVIILVNPTPAAITVDAHTIASGEIASFTLADSTTDLYAFVAEGCIAAPGSLTNGTDNVTDVIDNLTQLVEKGAFLLGGLVRAFLSAAGDAFAEAGV